ncbi:MAG: NAD kinase [Bacteroidaceae bacterium]
MKRVAIFGNQFQEKKSIHTQQLLDVLQTHQVAILIERQYYLYLENHFSLEEYSLVPFETLDEEVDLVISIGGDGTFLETARILQAMELPILGINTGHLGFLADIGLEHMEEEVIDILKGSMHIEKRSVLEVELIGEELPISRYALNEVAILKHDTSSMIAIETKVDGELLTTYQADGLIIATPTGSTAYSLSVGGPIMTPTCNTLSITPVAPHSLNIRPIVFSDSATITLGIKSRSNNYLVAIDGKSASVKAETTTIIKRAKCHINIVRRKDQTFFKTLRNKMMWGENNIR